MGINEHIALFAFNLIGLGLFMLVVSVFGKSRKARIETWQAAAEQFQTYRPDLTSRTGVVSKNNSTALLEVSDGKHDNLGIVTVLGDKLVGRLLPPHETQIDQRPNGLEITLKDITFPSIIVSMDHDDTVRWIELHERVKGENRWKA